MSLLEEHAQEEYHRLNDLYFSGALPDVEIEILADVRADGAKRSRCWGTTQKEHGSFRIQLLAGMPAGLQTLKLVHEMAHVKVWPSSHKSKAWRNEVQRLAVAGFLMEVF